MSNPTTKPTRWRRVKRFLRFSLEAIVIYFVVGIPLELLGISITSLGGIAAFIGAWMATRHLRRRLLRYLKTEDEKRWDKLTDKLKLK